MSLVASTASVALEIAGGVARVTIDNPAHRNALTKAMCVQLQDMMPRLDADPAVAVVTIRGAGATFSSGAAIDQLPAILLDEQDDGTSIDHLSLADEAIARVSKPTISIVDGACMGGGWQIASACDFIVASERSVFAITPAKIGVIYPRLGVERLVGQVGPATAKFVLFTGKTLSALEAQRLGLVADVLPDEGFADGCQRLVEQIAANSQFSIHALKTLIGLPATADADAAWERAWRATTTSPDMTIGVDAFLRRERPRFTWSPAG